MKSNIKWFVELLLGVPVFLVIYIFMQNAVGLPEVALKISALLLCAASLLLLFLGWTRLFEGKWKWYLADDGATGNLSAGAVTGFLYFLVYAGVMYLLGHYRPEYAHPNWTFILTNLAFNFLVACGEEVIFRGIVFRMIDERFGFWWALGISALIFGFIHMITPNATVWSSVAIAIEAGVLLGAAFKHSNSLWLPIGIHWAWNFTQGNVLGFSVSGHEKEETIFNALTDGPAILTGGDFGPEASVISVILGAAVSAYFIWMLARSNRI